MDSQLYLAPEGGDAYPIPLQNLESLQSHNVQSLNQANLHQLNLNANHINGKNIFNSENPFNPPSQQQQGLHSHHHHHHTHAALQTTVPDDARSFVSFSRRRHHDEMAPPVDKKPRKLVLCFDGTGNKFRGDDSDSNILKIFRMLDRTADDQYHYYQRRSPMSLLV